VQATIRPDPIYENHALCYEAKRRRLALDSGKKIRARWESGIPLSNQSALLVYRDCIVPRSEAHFLRRQYVGFRRLAPIWIGCRTDVGLPVLGVEPILLGRQGVVGAYDRLVFKQFGHIPPAPDLATLRPRLVHAHFGRGGALALPIARALKLPLVVTFHGGDATKDTHYRRRLVPTIYQRRCAALQREAALIICVAEHIREALLAQDFPASKLKVIRYGIEPEADSEPPRSREPPRLVFAGRFVEKKGVGYLLNAMRALERERVAVDLVLIGDGPMAEELKHQAAGLTRVRFLGWLPNDEVRRAMRGALAVCVPSTAGRTGDSEGLPNVVLEAMACGVPVIGSDVGGIGEAVEHNRTGFLVAPADPPAIVAAAQRLAGDPELRDRMGRAAKAVATERFGAAAQSRMLEEALLSVSDSAAS
jgi:colanic acid/amylovoran biosynthesis glycosyltransferase